MNALRPDLPPNLATTAPAAAPAAQLKAAQAAFFRAALNEVQAAPARAPASVTQAQEPDGPRPPRPGQLLDIRV